MNKPPCKEVIFTGSRLVPCARWLGHGIDGIQCATRETVELEARVFLAQQREVAAARFDPDAALAKLWLEGRKILLRTGDRCEACGEPPDRSNLAPVPSIEGSPRLCLVCVGAFQWAMSAASSREHEAAIVAEFTSIVAARRKLPKPPPVWIVELSAAGARDFGAPAYVTPKAGPFDRVVRDAVIYAGFSEDPATFKAEHGATEAETSR